MSALAYQVDKILEVAKQQSQLGVSGALLKHVQLLKDCLLPANPLTEYVSMTLLCRCENALARILLIVEL